MAKATTISLNIRGVNKTAVVFSQIASQAASVGKAIAVAGASGLAAFGAAGFAIARGAKELGKISDVAMRASSSAEDITRLSNALGLLGIRNADIDTIAQTFNYMTRAVGETGYEGFRRTLSVISQMPTEQARANEAMRVFGRTGMMYLPLIEAAAKNGIGALESIVDVMPGISSRAAQVGDEVADGMTNITNAIRVSWLNVIGDICSALSGQFVGGAREASMIGAVYIEGYTRKATRYIADWGRGVLDVWNAMTAKHGTMVDAWLNYFVGYAKAIGNFVTDMFNTTWSDWFEGRFLGDAPKNFARAMEDIGDELWDGVDFTPFISTVTDDIDREISAKIKAATIAASNIDKAAVISAKTVSDELTENTIDNVERVAEVVNTFRADMLESTSYRGATMAIRADYATGQDKVVRAIDKVKSAIDRVKDGIDNLNDDQYATIG